jgi:hypothetical protein
MKYQLSQILATPDEKYLNMIVNRATPIDVLANSSRFCKLDCRGYESPLTFKLKQGNPKGDISVFLSLVSHEPKR